MRNPDLNIIKPTQVVSSGSSLYLLYENEHDLETALNLLEYYYSLNQQPEWDNGRLSFSLGNHRPSKSNPEFLNQNYHCIELCFHNDEMQKETEQELSN